MQTTWVYVNSERSLWTVGFYDPSGKWHSDSDPNSREEAAERVHWLNGGSNQNESDEEEATPQKPKRSYYDRERDLW